VTRRHSRSQRKKQHNTISTKAQRSLPRSQATSRNPNFVLFALNFLIFFLILYHSNRNLTNFQLNWTEGVAYRNYTTFSMKFKAPSWLWVRCLTSQICASCRGQTRLGRHIISQGKNSTTRSARKLNGAHHGVMPLVEIQILHFLLLFFDIFWFCIT
jgi:hypothetical protein